MSDEEPEYEDPRDDYECEDCGRHYDNFNSAWECGIEDMAELDEQEDPA